MPIITAQVPTNLHCPWFSPYFESCCLQTTNKQKNRQTNAVKNNLLCPGGNGNPYTGLVTLLQMKTPANKAKTLCIMGGYYGTEQ